MAGGGGDPDPGPILRAIQRVAHRGHLVSADGIPLGYEVFAGNTADGTTIQTIVRAMERKYGRAQRIWVMDRGMVREENLKFIRERGGVRGADRSAGRAAG